MHNENGNQDSFLLVLTSLLTLCSSEPNGEPLAGVSELYWLRY